MHILHQLRFVFLLVLHCSPGEAGDPMLSSLLSNLCHRLDPVLQSVQHCREPGLQAPPPLPLPVSPGHQLLPHPGGV